MFSEWTFLIRAVQDELISWRTNIRRHPKPISHADPAAPAISANKTRKSKALLLFDLQYLLLSFTRYRSFH